jgi:hypothetical protein
MAQIEKPALDAAEKEKRDKIKAQLELQRKKDREMVRGIFRFHEVPGGNMRFPFKKYKGDPLETFDMNDGEVYTIPLGVAKHLNTNCWYPSYTFKNDEAGRPSVSVAEKIRRCSFQSLEFVDIEGLENNPKSALPA